MSVRTTTDPEMSGPCCGNCLFYTTMNGQGACRRNPPVPIFIGQGVNGFFAPVQPNIWCGEHQPARAGMAS